MATVASTPIFIVSGAPTTLKWWFKDPLDPDASIAVSLGPKTFDTTAADRQQVVDILTRPDPVVLSDAFGLPSLTFEIIFITDAEYQAFEALRATQHILLFQGPYPSGHWYVRLGATKSDSLNLPSLRGWAGMSSSVVRTIQITAQAVAKP